MVAFFMLATPAFAGFISVCLPQKNKCLQGRYSEDAEILEVIQIQDRQGQRVSLDNNDRAYLQQVLPYLSGPKHALVDVVLKFVPEGEVLPLQLLDFSDFHVASHEESKHHKSWTMICDAIGHEMWAQYSANSKLVQILAPVGDVATRCRGRCGGGCGSGEDHTAYSYTQECLNHDMCHSIEGQQLGVCADEMRDAVLSYLFAPRCH